MKNLFGWMLVVLLVLTAGVSCSDDEELLACGRSSNITRCCMVSTADSLLE